LTSNQTQKHQEIIVVIQFLISLQTLSELYIAEPPSRESNNNAHGNSQVTQNAPKFVVVAEKGS